MRQARRPGIGTRKTVCIGDAAQWRLQAPINPLRHVEHIFRVDRGALYQRLARHGGALRERVQPGPRRFRVHVIWRDR